jgi:aspartate/methionine/tyrosine aminotransferase
MRTFPKNEIVSLIGETPRYDLGESVGPDIHLGHLLDASGLPGFGDMALGYGTAAGNPRLRQAIGDSHGVGSDDVVVTVGGMHALFLIAFTLCEAGDEAVTTSPMFPLARNALDAVGADVRTVPLSFDRGYQLDVTDLGQQLSERTRLVSLASPQNPSGVAVPLKAIEDVVGVMAERCPEAYLLLDETYREATYGNDAAASSAIGVSPKVVSCASLSKCHGAPGLRLGWAITRDRALREHLISAKFNTVISCSPVDEALALRVLEQRDRILSERRRCLAEGLARLADWVVEHEGFVDWVRPDAGAICCVRLKPSVFGDVAVRRFYDVLAREGVRVAHGAWFGDEARVFRVGFGLLSMPDLKAALSGLSAAVRATAHSDA